MASNRSTIGATGRRPGFARELLIAVTGVTVLVAGCRRATVDIPAKGSGDASAPSTVVPDTIRGVIRRVGNDPLSVLVLQTKLGTVYSLRGAMLESLAKADGLDVMAQGTKTDQLDRSASPRGALVFEVKQFFVRGADGQVATDGILNEQGGRYFLVNMSGMRTDVPFLPRDLREKIGSWVFLVGALEKAPNAYGVLSERK